MPQLNGVQGTRRTRNAAGPAPAPAPDKDKAVKILAKSIYREVVSQGFDAKQVVALATELISCVTEELRDGSPQK